MKKYALRDPIPNDVDDALKAHHPLVRALLYARGISDVEASQQFLSPDYDKHVHDPYLLKDMKKVVERILKAIKNNEKIGDNRK